MKNVYALLGLYLIAVFTTPWFVVLPFGIALLVWTQSYAVVIFGAFLFDSLFGAPVLPLGGVSHVMTLLFVALAIFVYVLRRRLLE